LAPANVAAGTAFVEAIVVFASTLLFCTPTQRPTAAKETTATAKAKVRVDCLVLVQDIDFPSSKQINYWLIYH
jgi:hypothetical protein